MFSESSSELVSKFKNSVLVQKSIKSAIQRHLFFFSSEIEQERDPKTFNFVQIELWVDIHFFFKSSSELVSKFKNYIRLCQPIQSTIYRLLIFLRSSSGLVFKFKNSILVQKSINSAIQRLLIFSDWALRTLFFVFRSSSGLVFIFKNSTLVQKSINSAIQRLLIFVFRLSSAYVILCFQIELRVGF